MEKKETNTHSIFQRPVWVSLFALTAAISWGWAYPLIKMGMEEYQITADMTGSKMLFAGIRFFISGIIILAIARSSHRKFGFKKEAVQENVWFLLLYALLNTTLHYAFFYFGLSHNAGARSAILNSMSVFTVVFNALTEIPEDVKIVYLNIGDVSLADGDVTIGNKDICDMWTWDRNTDHYVGEILEDGRKVYMVRDTDTIYSSNKAGITLYISGSVKDNPEGGLNQSDSHTITFSIPDASNVVFTKDFTMNGYFRMSTGWSDGRNLGGAFYNRTVKSVLFDRSTFNGIWIQNGGFFADSLTLDGCTFNAYENTASANDSNPLWFCNIRTCDVTVKNCTFKASRPIKVVEQAVFGANVTITGNKFDMSLTNSANDASKPKNDAIMFSTLIGETQWNPAGTLGNVVVSGNEVTGANALLTFFNPSQITMAKGATFKVSDNTLNGAKLSVEWKTATEYAPDFVK